MIIALSFVPIPHLKSYIHALSGNTPPELQPLLTWFEDNYVGWTMRSGGGRRSPLFPLDIWSLYDRTIVERDRTNNHEGARTEEYTSSCHMEIYRWP